MSYGSEWYQHGKPDPTPEHAIRPRKAKRNRAKLPRPKLDPATLEEVPDRRYEVTSSEKGRGRKRCIELGEHDWVKTTKMYTLSDGRVVYNPIIFCRRCYEFGRKL